MQALKNFIPFLLAQVVISSTLLMLTTRPAYASPPTENQHHTVADFTSARLSYIAAATAVTPTFNTHPLQTPGNGTLTTTTRPIFSWQAAQDDVAIISYTLRITGTGTFSGLLSSGPTADITSTALIYTPTLDFPAGVYTWTIQAHDGAGLVSGFVAPFTFTLQPEYQTFLPLIFTSECPTTSSANFALIPIEGGVATDHPPPLHGDLNLALRGYNVTNAAKSLVDYSGSTDSNAPQLAGLFAPNQFPGISQVYRVNNWDWGCGTHGCAAEPITNPDVTLMALLTSGGQNIYIPERGAEIYGGGYKVMVLYAEEQRITLGYTRRDSVAQGYSVQIENVCVDPNLLALYQAQTGANGWHTSGNLPALKNDQALGTALDNTVIVAIKDRGTYMDPRSRKDWWMGY